MPPGPLHKGRARQGREERGGKEKGEARPRIAAGMRKESSNGAGGNINRGRGIRKAGWRSKGEGERREDNIGTIEKGGSTKRDGGPKRPSWVSRGLVGPYLKNTLERSYLGLCLIWAIWDTCDDSQVARGAAPWRRVGPLGLFSK